MRFLLVIFLQCFVSGLALCQSLTISDVLNLSTIPSKSIDNYLGKKGFVLAGNSTQYDDAAIHFMQKRKTKKDDVDSIVRTVDLYKKEDCYFFILNTSSALEYTAGCAWLKKHEFFSGSNPDSTPTAPHLFQRRNYTVNTSQIITEEDTAYQFKVCKRVLPEGKDVQYAEDLLRFDSHEYLVSFFGPQNVKKDFYYFSENELKKCSVLFPNTNEQAIFIWNDEENYNNLAYVLISGILPTMSAVQYTGFVSQNKWVSKTGLYSGMSLTDLVRTNKGDANFFGRNSEFSFLIDPQSKGEIDFKKCGVMLGCVGCGGGDFLEKEKISSLAAVERNLQLYIFYLMISK
jgi:hypothetical protein